MRSHILSATQQEPRRPEVQRDPREILVEDAIRRQLIDPGSAEFAWPGRWLENQEFRFWRWSHAVHGDVVCGSVNARNRMGGYVGRSYFLAVVNNGQVAELHVDSATGQDIDILAMRCQRLGF